MERKVSLIQETAFVPSPGQVQILQEGYDESGIKKVTVRAVLQSSTSTPNQNGRIYPPEVLQSVVEQLKPKAVARNLLCELDHPLTPSSDPAVLKRRAAVVSLEHACAMITDLEFDGQNITGVLEILNTPKGKVVQQLLHDKVNFGFSLRALGTTQADANGNLVVGALKAITFDIVANPSHKEARVVEVFNESASLASVLKDFEMLQEEVTETSDMEAILENTDFSKFTEETLLEESESESSAACFNGVCALGTVDELTEFIIENAFADARLNKLQLRV